MIKKIQSNDRLLLLIIALPAILHLFIFKYLPLAGNVIVFQNYNMFQGILGSSWVGFEHFIRMFTYEEFYRILKNTMLFSFYSLVFGFPAPLMLALLLNEVVRNKLKRPIQTLLYLPHFLSWVIVGGIFISLLSIDGLLNRMLQMFGAPAIDYLTLPEFFRTTVIGVGIWKEVGWGMIIYLAALAGVNPNLYEAAMVDGAGRWRRMWNVSLPALMPAIVVLFLLRIGNLLDANVEQILIFLNPLNREAGEVIDTYVYRLGLLRSQFSYTTAIGIFKSIIGLVLIVGLNRLSKATTGESIY